jgi:ABC-type transport system involved in multi-copper enzyme maturation permease subunit
MNNAIALAGVVIKELYRRKDFYVLFVMTALLTLVLGSMRFFNNAEIVRFLKEICLMLIWLSMLVIAITTAARQIPAERESRTILPLLAKPVSRWELILGKFAGCWLACLAALAVFYFFFGVLTASHAHVWPGLIFFQAFLLHGVFLAVVVALVLFGSVVFTAQSSNATISAIVVAGILFVGGHLDRVAGGMKGFGSDAVYAVYFAIPHLEWYYNVQDFVIHDWQAIPWVYIAGATLYGALYTLLLLGLTWLVFRRKTLTL